MIGKAAGRRDLVWLSAAGCGVFCVFVPKCACVGGCVCLGVCVRWVCVCVRLVSSARLLACAFLSGVPSQILVNVVVQLR